MKRDFETDINYQYLLLLFFVTNFIVKRQIDFFYSILALTVLLSLEDFIPCYYCQSIHNNFTTIFQE